MKKLLLLATVLLLLSSCVGGTLSDTKEFEMFPLRSASQSEGKELKRCLKTAHQLQEHKYNKTGHYARKLKELPIDNHCGDFLMAQKSTPNGYEIAAEIREDEHAVRWSVNEKGEIDEHLDEREDDQFMEF